MNSEIVKAQRKSAGRKMPVMCHLRRLLKGTRLRYCGGMQCKILIAAPAYGRQVHTAHHFSMIALVLFLERNKITFRYPHAPALADIALSRNYLATCVLEDETITHLLFVDSDVSHRPASVDKLLKADRHVIGCVYPQRNINIPALLDAARRFPNDKEAVAAATGFVLAPSNEQGDIIPATELGMGLTLIRRDVLEKLAASVSRRNATIKRPIELKGPILGFFDRIDDGNGYLQEDQSFCKRWRDAGGSIFALTTETVGHMADIEVTGCYADHLSAIRQSGVTSNRIVEADIA